MKLTINQPYFLPYIGLMEKAKMADVLLVNDFSPISAARRIHRRVKILDLVDHNKYRYLTELVYHWDDGKPFNQIYLDENFFKRIDEIIKTLHHTYAKAKYYNYFSEELYKAMLNRKVANLGEYNFNLINLLLKKLSINTKIILASQLKIFKQEEFLKTPAYFVNHATFMAFKMCQLLKATTYISGQSGPKYLDEKPFLKEKINVVYQEIQFRSYPQFENGTSAFIEGLSVVDLIFNCGPQAKNYIGKNSKFTQK